MRPAPPARCTRRWRSTRDRDATRIDLAHVLLEHSSAAGRLEEAAAALAGVSAAGRLEPRWATLNTQLQSQQRASELPGTEALLERIAADPADLPARLDLANVLMAQRDFAPALEQLLEIVERDRAFGDDIARRLMLSVFDLAADQPQLVSSFRRRLAAALNRCTPAASGKAQPIKLGACLVAAAKSLSPEGALPRNACSA